MAGRATMKAIEEAARSAGAHEFVMKLKEVSEVLRIYVDNTRLCSYA